MKLVKKEHYLMKLSKSVWIQISYTQCNIIYYKELLVRYKELLTRLLKRQKEITKVACR